MSHVCDCTRPCGDAFACTTCATTARENLRHIADLMRAIDEKRAKLGSSWDVSNLGAAKPAKRWRVDSSERTTFAAHAGFRPSTALSFDPRVSRVGDRVHNALVGIVRELPDPVPLPTVSGPTCRGCAHESCRRIRFVMPTLTDHTSVIARWLSYRVHDIRLQTTANEIFDLISRAAGDLMHLFDNPPPKLFLGECKMIGEDGNECHESIYLDADKVTSSEVACPRCGITHDVAERRKVLMEGVDDYLATAKEISRLLRQIAGSDVSERRIREMAGHGLLTRMGTRREYGRDGAARNVATYRIGDVRKQVADIQERREKRRAAKGQANGRSA